MNEAKRLVGPLLPHDMPRYELLVATMRWVAEMIAEHLKTEDGCEVGPLTEFSMPSYGLMVVTNGDTTKTYFILTPSKWPPKSVKVLIVDGEVTTIPPEGGFGRVETIPLRVKKVARRLAS